MTTPSSLRNRVCSVILLLVSAFYAYGALVHVLNMLSLTGFDWTNAPIKWQVLDIVYLVLDVLVVAGLYRVRQYAVFAFYTAALSQIVVYTVLRSWIMDVPEAYAITPEQNTYLTGLVIYHLITLTLVSLALKFRPAQDKLAT
ncbi:MAG: hypothetical protein AAF993_21780 [Pseudomonadota bacterium]